MENRRKAFQICIGNQRLTCHSYIGSATTLRDITVKFNIQQQQQQQQQQTLLLWKLNKIYVW